MSADPADGPSLRHLSRLPCAPVPPQLPHARVGVVRRRPASPAGAWRGIPPRSALPSAHRDWRPPAGRSGTDPPATARVIRVWGWRSASGRSPTAIVRLAAAGPATRRASSAWRRGGPAAWNTPPQVYVRVPVLRQPVAAANALSAGTSRAITVRRCVTTPIGRNAVKARDNCSFVQPIMAARRSLRSGRTKRAGSATGSSISRSRYAARRWDDDCSLRLRMSRACSWASCRAPSRNDRANPGLLPIIS